MAERRFFHAPGVQVQALAEALARWFRRRGYEAQVLPAEGGAVAVQARQDDALRTLAGLSAALQVVLTPQGDNLMAQFGSARWADKAVVGVVTAIWFWPLMALPAYGAYKQKALGDQACRFIERYVARAEQASTTQMPARHVVCPACGGTLRPQARFCDQCGTRLSAACAHCGATLRPGARFCVRCGARVEALA